MRMRKCFTCSFGDCKPVIDSQDSHIVRCKCGMLYDPECNFVQADVEEIYSIEPKDGYYSFQDRAKIIKNRRPIKRELAANIAQFFDRPWKNSLLDIGCSYGDFLQLIAEYGFSIYGLDVSKRACGYTKVTNVARNFHGNLFGYAYVFHGSLFKAAYPSNYFNAVNLSAVLIHVDDPKQLMSEIYRILKPGGLLFIDDKSHQCLWIYSRLFKWLTGADKSFQGQLNLFTCSTFKKFIKTTPFELVKIFKYGYSHPLIQSYLPDHLKTWVVKLLLWGVRVTKVDRLLGVCDLFQAVLRKPM